MACWPISEPPNSATGDDYSNHVALQSNEKSTQAGHLNHMHPQDKESSCCRRRLKRGSRVVRDQDYETSSHS